ncbi:hypothetical protein CDAR_474481 [Caerostris darwini]|uniref:Uncharacterized protein n=1 Tax=Caerostris darwini TaxID=1538125 RepID=A0AAV4RFH4_9ARAC|nr:hypothetical protein CDAR_474481 [Caerostris darwini]
MIDMEVSMEGNGPSQVHQQVPSSPGSDVNAMKDPTKMTPKGLCHRSVSAHHEMEVIDEILTSAKNSDFQNDNLQLKDNLSKKKEYLLEWLFNHDLDTEFIRQLFNQDLDIEFIRQMFNHGYWIHGTGY